MTYAILSDIHGNLEALEVALASIRRRKVDRVVCLGDLVGYGADPSRCVKRIEESADVVLLGNHDSAAIGSTSISMFTRRAQISTQWTHEQLTEENVAFLDSLPLSWSENGLLAVHASPCEPKEWHYILDRRAADEAFGCFGERICFVGHSHVPVLFQESEGMGSPLGSATVALDAESRYIINVGSVGQPRDSDPRLAYAIYDTDKGTIQLCREEYDVSSASGKILSAGLPEELGKRLYFGM